MAKAYMPLGQAPLLPQEEEAGAGDDSPLEDPLFGEDQPRDRPGSSLAGRVRAVLDGRPASAVMVLTLIGALLLPDLWVALGVNSNLEIDLALLFVLAFFTIEIALRALVDSDYFLSVLFWMDVVGTVSVVLDISFLAGQDATMPDVQDADMSGQMQVFMRSTRAARVCARAGRLSRLPRVLRILQCTGEEASSDHKSLASNISGQLSDLLSSRVAFLTLTLVLAMPFFDLLSFPQADLSLQAWVDRASASFEAGDTQKAMRNLREMTQFFSDNRYGPYKACRGHAADDDALGFVCEEELSGWQDVRPAPLVTSGPPREASALLVRTDSLQVGFNMHDPARTRALLTILTTAFIVLIMVASGLALSAVVTELAVQPLERMLGTVRAMASAVGAVPESLENDGEEEVDTENEMRLLEQVVGKLASIVELHTGAKAAVNTEGLDDQDLGILNLLNDRVSWSGGGSSADKRRQWKSTIVGLRGMGATEFELEPFGLSRDTLQSWAFNTLPMTSVQQCAVATFTISEFHDKQEGFVPNQDALEVLQCFVQSCEKEYKANPFHNFAHASDVVHGTAKIMRLVGSERFLSELEQFALLIAAVGHDVGHPGVNNGFLLEVGDELAVRYNDKSPLENMHCATLYSILQRPENNVLHRLSRDQYKEVRRHCIETILHTDMMNHQQMVKDLSLLYQVNSEAFKEGDTDIVIQESALFKKADHKVLAMNMVLHSADVSNPCRTWEVTRELGLKVVEEFFLQGDQEMLKGIPVQFLNDRENLSIPNSQIGFIEFMIAPFFVAQMQLFPGLREYGHNLAVNIVNWEDAWNEESKPSEDERTKVAQRVAKVRENLSNAPLRLTP